MADITLYAHDELDFDVQRTDDEIGEIVLIITADGEKVEIKVGQSLEDAEQLRDAMQNAAKAVTGDIIDGWENRPDVEDGFVTEDGRGYLVVMAGKHPDDMPHNGYRSRDVATYELARLMANQGYFPNAWYQGERGMTDSINEAVQKHYDAEGSSIKPLPGVKYAEGDNVLLDKDDPDAWHGYVVDHDYGDLGVMLYMSGDPSITEFAEHDRITPDEEDEED